MIAQRMKAFIGCVGSSAIAMLWIGCAQIFDFDKEYRIRGESADDGGAVGGGGGGDAGGGAGGGLAELGCDMHEVPPEADLQLSLIDDLEDGNLRIKYMEGRHASWFMFSDTTGGVQTPTDPARLVTAIEPPRPGSNGEVSKMAMHTTGEGFTSWGAGFGTDLNTSYYDASEFRGITFWARADGDSIADLNVAFVDRQTYWEGGVCEDQWTDPHKACNDHFHTSITLDSQWRYFHATFACLVQQGFGMRFDELAVDELKTLQFTVVGPQAFSLWIDDVSFYR
ncbi:hypothetical protein WME99_08670 [Sorangium sp. So ce136]|uniref:hypothetical protein n=1 Tax=Sorangium sp. So ce136 TaxID=3133284 RepID=UPI003F074EF7